MHITLIAAAVLAGVCVLLICPVRARLQLSTLTLGAELRFGVRMFRGPVKMDRAVRCLFEPGRGFRLYSVKKNKVKPVRRKKKTKNKLPVIYSILRALKVLRLDVSGSVGIGSDAAACALIAGSLGGIVDSAERIAFAVFWGGSMPGQRSIRIMPDFAKNTFSLRAEGILETDLHKLIKSLAEAYLKK